MLFFWLLSSYDLSSIVDFIFLKIEISAKRRRQKFMKLCKQASREAITKIIAF
jgi:hypothetical protein